MTIREKILVIEDEKSISHFISTVLNNNGYEAMQAQTGEEALSMISSHCPDLIILDIMMPGMDGFALCTAIRRESRVPIIIVSAKDAPMDRVTGITLGSDDYMVKPFLPLELVARVKALFRRAGYIRQDAGETLVCANLSLDPRSRCMTVDGAHFSVTPTEFAFLQYLMERRGEAVSKQVLLKEVWELPDYDLDTRVADDLVKRLRRKFREAGCRAAIETVWGYGFRLEEDRGERS